MRSLLCVGCAAALSACHLLLPYEHGGGDAGLRDGAASADRPRSDGPANARPDQTGAGDATPPDAAGADGTRPDLSTADALPADGAADAPWDGPPRDAPRDGPPQDAPWDGPPRDAPWDGPPRDAPGADQLLDHGALDVLLPDGPASADALKTGTCVQWSDWTQVVCNALACMFTCTNTMGTTFSLSCSVEAMTHPLKALCSCEIDTGGLAPCGPATNKVSTCDEPCATEFAGGCCNP